uniref:BPTI/Kunitz inhibitor domain-containing protein n=1 Tax=Fundulus heteroclitus TaxID=8078 RepID=A0A3Q2PB09_FUNHE
TDLPDQLRLSNLQPAYCLAPAKVGPCRAAFARWHYDAQKGSCEQFTYGGCKPNKNNFLSESECMSACRGVAGNTHT